MKLLYIMFISIFCIFICSCKKDTSELNQITSQIITCTSLEQRLETLRQNYEKYFTPSQYTDKALLVLSNIPNEYFEHIFTQKHATVKILGLKTKSGSYCGFTSVKGQDINPKTGDPIGPIKRVVGHIESHVECLAHEFGHDSFVFLTEYNKKRGRNFVAALTRLSETLHNQYQNQIGDYLNSYDLNDPNRLDEVLAELFDTWYCSQSARNLLENILPAYNFASTYLLPPLDLDNPTVEETSDQTDESDTQTLQTNNQVRTSKTTTYRRPLRFGLGIRQR